MTYHPETYWRGIGRQPPPDTATDVFRRQEAALMRTLEGLEFASILEVGCGWGRITKLVSGRWPTVPYTAFDLSPDRVAKAMLKVPAVEFVVDKLDHFAQTGIRGPERYDLVLCVEMLMHVPESDIVGAVEKLLGLANRYVVSVDWAVPIKGEIAPWNALHDYPALYGKHLQSVEQIGQQAIYVAAP